MAGIQTPLFAHGARPFLKWAGGKTQLLGQLESLRPTDVRTYHEPFLGGGATFFAWAPPRACLSDANPELINCYVAVRDNVEELIAELSRHFYDREHYYAVRAQEPRSLSPVAQAARTIFLNKTGFNGLHRVNARGVFNVPFGRHRKPVICDEKNLRACSESLRAAELACRDFTRVLDSVTEGDFVYLDPPYEPLSETSHFTSYGPGGFRWDEQEKLAAVFAQLSERRVKAMLSNSDVPRLRELYSDYRIEVVLATRRINSRTDGRGMISEIVVLNY